MTVAVLFARGDSVYKSLPGCDVYDASRDARTYDGPWPVVAHPPCRGWGSLRAFAKPRADERNLGRLAVALVREFGGVLEHPAFSALWASQAMALPGSRDSFGGWTFPAPQQWWGHRAKKDTWFYICGVEPADLPPIPFVMGEATHVIAQCKTLPDGSRVTKGHRKWKPETTKTEREATPLELAHWLLELAGRARTCSP